MTKTTKVEQKIFEAWALEIPGIDVKTHIHMIRERIKEVAYHEAGHTTVSAFLGGNIIDFNGISIIPTSETLGCFSREGYCPPLDMDSGKLQWVKGQIEIIENLAGRVAGSRVSKDVEYLKDALMNGWENTLFDSEDQWRLNTDEGRALAIAELLSKRGWSPLRILFMMEKWTNELIDIPAVWKVVEEIAHKLINNGEIIDFEEYSNMVHPILCKFQNSPVWKRRFYPKDLYADLKILKSNFLDFGNGPDNE